jgi:hypothetical protein
LAFGWFFLPGKKRNDVATAPVNAINTSDEFLRYYEQGIPGR